MYSGHGFRDFNIGDVDVIKHGDTYHLFHLTLPNHDYIAHAVSKDGLHWRRVKNAIFISDPEDWDDDMLWTMHISSDPYHKGRWRMFYTGLCLHEHGRIQRIGLAVSDDLYDWRKVRHDSYPLNISDEYYESRLDEGRHWVSFRDPFCFHDNGEVYLLAAGRVKEGPIMRRGCVALLRETGANLFESLPPLFHPMRYDDIEVPNLIRLRDKYYLIGSIREDIKVHYWYADKFDGPYQNFHDNVLLPQGNYAGRICWAEDRYLIWNFFYKASDVTREQLMAPPKELHIGDDGQLHLKSFRGFDDLISKELDTSQLTPLKRLFKNPFAGNSETGTCCSFGSESGFEVFTIQGTYKNFIFTGKLNMEGKGKCGFVIRANEQGDGYYLSLDLFKGLAQIRAWAHKPEGGIEGAFHYQQLQAAHYIPRSDPHSFKLIVYEQYIEFSLSEYVLLTLADNQFSEGYLGFYAESAQIRIDEMKLSVCTPPKTKSYPLGLDNY